MSEKINPHSRTPNTPEHTLKVNPDCRVIRLKGPAGKDLPQNTGMKELLLAVQSETESLLQQLELHQDKSKVL